MKVIDTLWFTTADGTIGIVTIEEDITGDRKAYIGTASGKNEREDANHILVWGNKFSLDTVKRLQHFLTKKEKSKKG